MSSGYQDKMQCHLERLWSNVLCPNFQIQLWNSSSLESFNIGCRDFRIEKFLHRNFLQDGKLWLWFKMKGFDLKASYWLKILCFHPILKQQEYPYYGQHRSFITIMHEIFFLCHFLLLLMFFLCPFLFSIKMYALNSFILLSIWWQDKNWCTFYQNSRSRTLE